MSMERSPHRTPSLGDFLSDAVSLVADDPRIVLVTVVGGALSAIPFVGTFLNLLVVGFAHVLAQQSLGWSVDSRTSLPVRLVYLLIGSIVAGIAVLIGLVFLVLPGLYLVVRFSLMVPAIMVDGKGPLDGIGESWDRAGGNWWTIFGFQLVVGIASALVIIPVVFSFGLEAVANPANLTPQIAIGVVSGAFGAITVGGLVMMYRAFGEEPAQQQDDEWQDPSNDAQW